MATTLPSDVSPPATQSEADKCRMTFDELLVRVRRVIHDSGATLAVRKKLLDELQLHAHLMKRTLDAVHKNARKG